MLLLDDLNLRWQVLCPLTHEGHRPSAGYRRQESGIDFHMPENLAASASVSVDSFFGTCNLEDEAEFYPVVNQVHLDWKPRPGGGLVDLHFSTVTPCFAGFQWSIDGGASHTCKDTALCWALHPGRNTFEIRSINSAGHAGAAASLVFNWQPGNPPSIAEEKNGIACAGSIPFLWEDFSHPRLQALRQKYQLDTLVAGAANDLEKVARIRDWLKSRWDHSQPIISPPWDAFYMLDRTDKKIEAFYCVHYSVAFMQCCLALGIPARLLNLGRGICTAPIDIRGYGRELDKEHPCDEHVINEVWLDDEGRWVMMDVDFDIHYERNGRVLSALDIHRTLIENKLDELTVCEGPLAYKLRSSDRFYQYLLTVYYTHFSVFWRNNHLSDPDGPTRILHWVDKKTPPMLWWEGSDLRHRPSIIGPLGISWPYELSTPRLTDQNVLTCWASAENPAPHWVELSWSHPQMIDRVVVDWAECWQRYWTSNRLVIEAWVDSGWQVVFVKDDQAEAAYTILQFEPVRTNRLRIVQPVSGGHREYPNRLWLSEIEVYAPEAKS